MKPHDNDRKHMLGLGFAAAGMTALLVASTNLAVDNNRLRNELLQQTVGELQDQYDVVLQAEARRLLALQESLHKVYTELTLLDELTQEEDQYIRNAMRITDDLVDATYSRGIDLD